MSTRSPAARTLGFTVLYLMATYAGRLTVMDQNNLSLVWPAAGVSAVWALAQYTSRWRALDALALAAVTMAVNLATGAPLTLAAWFVVANLVQAGLFAYLVRRWLPELWGAGGDQPLARVHQLGPLAAAALLSVGCGTLLGPTGLWAVSGVYSWPAVAVWLTRNTVSILLIGVAGLRVGHLVAVQLRGVSRADLRDRLSAVRPARKLEYLAVVVLSVIAYLAVFGVNRTLPLAFTVIGMTVWAGTRLHTAFVVLHDLVFGSVAVLFTLHGDGVFAQIGSYPARALVAQVFVGMLAVTGLALALSRDERVALVHDLRGAQRAAAAQAKLMNTIVDSMSEGLTVVDEQGRLLLRNPAVRELVGGDLGRADRMAGGPENYGLMRPDGSPLPAEEMPYRRALAGRDVRDMDVLIRSPGLTDARVLSVSSRALPADLNGARCAVTVFRDVTAERRHRGELASFAGVVAHDLLNPLTTVEGWTEALAETFGDSAHPDAAEARDGLTRIGRAAARMRDLINDLLAYTTARDATVAPAMLDLREIAADIATARIDQAQSSGRPAPVFRIGDLHPVYADPVLIRQLLDNLISNAVKYIAPGVTPHLRIGTSVAAGLVTVTIDDNGIGIPAGQHGSIFDNFHRAHAGAGYTGTGLGLGICKRIVERHGGTITAGDNPDGAGSRFTFTLPADASSAPAAEPAGPESPGGAAEPAAPRAEFPEADGPEADGPEAAALPTAGTFERAARLVLDYLHEQMPLAFWAVTRVENGRQTFLYLDPDNGYGLRQGQSHAWEDSYCMHMAAGRAPAVARDARSVPVYAAAGVNDRLDIGTYAGAPIAEPDGSLFGAICGLDPQAHTGDPRMAGAESLLTLLGRLLTIALAADRAQYESVTTRLREHLVANTDELTGLPNRRAWDRAVAEAESRHRRLADPTVVAVLGLDPVRAGDPVQLRTVADTVRAAVRRTDILARLDDDEFGLLLNGCDRADAELTLGRLHLELADAGAPVSIGWACVTAERGLAAALAQAHAGMAAAAGRRQRPAAPISTAGS
ncbi:ATP-binding protein [Actinoplanes teichomyceticus]|uniref:Sensor-like histidine kinase SenX3 n=1 Tax=Actinoplanes teichomyceticus TaxID=1867 RepID=A0A561VCN3_ACTTI|nr:ATP-binding protein [Actinoplanes teichomyceticus]TWG09370.1 phospho-acceptor domain-containing protein [Actinoplanes teichomyceticus]GIF17213.1 hypothetical protein Ate01nite_72450 [Actinoplanes teichomyceticus]